MKLVRDFFHAHGTRSLIVVEVEKGERLTLSRQLVSSLGAVGFGSTRAWIILSHLDTFGCFLSLLLSGGLKEDSFGFLLLPPKNWI